MGAVSVSDGGRLHSSQIPHAIRFLRNGLRVPATRIAGILGETADNIRHIDIRSKALARSAPSLGLVQDDLAQLRLDAIQRAAQVRRNLQGIRIRTKQDLDQTEATVWSIFNNHQSVRFEEGYEALLAILPGVANARHGHALKVRLLLQEKLAWFAMPIGRIAKALGHAEAAMVLARDAFRESAGDRQYLLRYGEAALVASICLQKMHQPRGAIDFIRAADEANRAAGQLPGSEHLRQRGASLIQMGSTYDDRADKAFSNAPERMRRKNEAKNPVDIEMIGIRQHAYLDPSKYWDTVQELAQSAAAVYGKESIQYGVAAKSAAGVGLKIGTPESNRVALDLLYSISPVCSIELPKGVPHILSMTPDLRLSAADRDRWLRFALNESPLIRS